MTYFEKSANTLLDAMKAGFDANKEEIHRLDAQGLDGFKIYMDAFIEGFKAQE